MKKIIQYILNMSYVFFLTISCAMAGHHEIRLAVFDNPQPDPSRNENAHQFINSYLLGINTAITVAANKGIYITEREFFHANSLTSIIQQASDAKTWKPDVI